jgi:hypothetical protein
MERLRPHTSERYGSKTTSQPMASGVIYTGRILKGKTGRSPHSIPTNPPDPAPYSGQNARRTARLFSPSYVCLLNITGHQCCDAVTAGYDSGCVKTLSRAILAI